MKYSKTSGVSGGWIKASEVKDGAICKLKSECSPMESEWGTQDVAKLQIKGENEAKNVKLNKTTINGLIDAYGDDSKLWIDKLLTARPEKAIVGGKRVTILYLVPEGYEIKEANDGFMKIVKEGTKTDKQLDEDFEKVNDSPEYPVEDINVDEVPF